MPGIGADTDGGWGGTAASESSGAGARAVFVSQRAPRVAAAWSRGVEGAGWEDVPIGGRRTGLDSRSRGGAGSGSLETADLVLWRRLGGEEDRASLVEVQWQRRSRRLPRVRDTSSRAPSSARVARR